MQRKYSPKGNLDYLHNKREIVWWKIIAGPPDAKLSILQEYDVIFDNHDRKMRQL